MVSSFWVTLYLQSVSTKLTYINNYFCYFIALTAFYRAYILAHVIASEEIIEIINDDDDD